MFERGSCLVGFLNCKMYSGAENPFWSEGEGKSLGEISILPYVRKRLIFGRMCERKAKRILIKYYFWPDEKNKLSDVDPAPRAMARGRWYSGGIPVFDDRPTVLFSLPPFLERDRWWKSYVKVDSCWVFLNVKWRGRSSNLYHPKERVEGLLKERIPNTG